MEPLITLQPKFQIDRNHSSTHNLALLFVVRKEQM